MKFFLKMETVGNGNGMQKLWKTLPCRLDPVRKVANFMEIKI